MTHVAQDERAALADLFIDVGPAAPTLCEGWSCADLAAHLVIRERRPDAALGILVPTLAAYSERVRRATRDGSAWVDLVAEVRDGPPLPLRVALVDEAINTVEYFVHHEDVRRARPGWEPRHLPAATEAALWNRLRTMGRLLFRRSPVGVTLDAPGYGAATAKAGQPGVTLTGAPGELVLFGSGRDDHARVEVAGDEVTTERFRHTRLGL